MKRNIFLIIMLSLFLAYGCNNKAPEKVELKKVRLATAKNLWCALSIIALEKNYFKDEGLDVEPQFLQGGRYCLDALLANSADFANIVEVNVSYLGFTGNDNTTVIGTIVSSTSSAIVARKSSGIIKPEEIKNKKLGLSPGMTSDIFAYRFLNKYNINMNDVTIINLQPLAMQGAIISRGVDAVSTWEPFVYNIEKSLGSDAIVFHEPKIYLGYENIAVRKDWANKNADIVKSFLKANKKAEEFIKSNPEEAQKILAKFLNLDLEVVKDIWNTFDFTLLLDRNQLLGDIQKEGNWINKTQEAYKNKEIPSYNKYIDTLFISKLNNN